MLTEPNPNSQVLAAWAANGYNVKALDDHDKKRYQFLLSNTTIPACQAVAREEQYHILTHMFNDSASCLKVR